MPCITDMAGVIDAMHTSKLRTVAMATPFRQFINDRLVKYLATEQITITHNKALGIERNTEIRRLPIPVEYQTARTGVPRGAAASPTGSTFRAAAGAACTTSSRWSATSTPRSSPG